MPHVARDVHDSYRGMTGFLSQTLAITTSVTRGVEPGRAPPTRLSRKARMLLSFQRPSRPVGKGSPSKGRSPRAEALGSGSRSVAPLDGGWGAGSDPVPAPLSGSIRTDRGRAWPGRRADVPAPRGTGPIPC